MSSGYSDSGGTHINANDNGVCGHCGHYVDEHYFLDNAEFAHCNNGSIFTHCKCKKLRKTGWTKPVYVEAEVLYESS